MGQTLRISRQGVKEILSPNRKHLENVSFGELYFKIALLFREGLFLSSLFIYLFQSTTTNRDFQTAPINNIFVLLKISFAKHSHSQSVYNKTPCLQGPGCFYLKIWEFLFGL